MRRNFLIILISIFVLIFKVNYINVNAAYTQNGHDDIEWVDFYDSRGFLLCDVKLADLKKARSYCNKSKFFGWKTYYYNVNKLAKYDGEVLFSRSNQTSNDVKFTFSIKETTTDKRSVSVSNTIVAKGSGGKKITASLQEELEVEISTEHTYSVVESLDYAIIVPKGKKVVMKTYGECMVSNGMSAYFAFWIKTKSGSWEIIDIKTIYYKLEESTL